jgi:acyl-coenzyme A thioesterase PaaI-like protein
VYVSARRLRWILNLWPPFLFTGIRVRSIAADYSRAEVTLRKRWYNRNAVGTQFGGSLFAMTDPFWMLMVMQQLGRDYVVWDKAAEIEFVAPGRGHVHARFQLDTATVEAIRAATADGGRHLRWFDTDVVDDQGQLIARVRKQLYVRRKRS